MSFEYFTSRLEGKVVFSSSVILIVSVQGGEKGKTLLKWHVRLNLFLIYFRVFRYMSYTSSLIWINIKNVVYKLQSIINLVVVMVRAFVSLQSHTSSRKNDTMIIMYTIWEELLHLLVGIVYVACPEYNWQCLSVHQIFFLCLSKCIVKRVINIRTVTLPYISSKGTCCTSLPPPTRNNHPSDVGPFTLCPTFYIKDCSSCH